MTAKRGKALGRGLEALFTDMNIKRFMHIICSSMYSTYCYVYIQIYIYM